MIVPYDQVAAHAMRYDALRVASLEHLCVLKLEAYRDRRSSAKGQKDAKDLIRIGLASLAQKRSLERFPVEMSRSDIKCRGALFLPKAKTPGGTTIELSPYSIANHLD